MRWLMPSLVLLLTAGCAGSATSARITKVLPHLLDEQGRHTVAPSLFERDAYQAELRANPERVGGLRFDVHWRTSSSVGRDLRLRLELRGTATPETLVVEQAVEPRAWYDRWSAIPVDEATSDQLGEIVAWRVSLLNRETLLAEQKSFLW